MLDVGIWNPRVGLPKTGGTETFLRNISRELHTIDDVSVTIYTHTNGTIPKTIAGMDIREVPTVPKTHWGNRLLTGATPALDSEVESLSSYLYGKATGVLDTHDVLSTHYYLDGLLLSRSTDTPTVFRLPGIKQSSPRWNALFQYSDIDCYISNSHTTSRRVQSWYNRELVGPVYAGVDCDRFKPTEKREPQRVLFVGRLGEGKGLHNLVDAAKILPDHYSVRLVGDGPLEADLKERAPSCVEFVGTVPHDKIHREYQRATVLCLPSVHEGFPVTVIEALATGTPVVSTDLDSTNLTVEDTVTGRLLSDRTPESIASAVREVCTNAEYTHNARKQGREVVKQYDWSEQAARYRNILSRVVSNA